jgi:C-terminal processing protease CtpA/Prc
MAPLTGMPAEKAGVKAGDYILNITDEAKGINKDTYGMSLMEAVELIRGEKGQK